MFRNLRLGLLLLFALTTPVGATSSIYDLTMQAIEGGDLRLERYRNQPILLVNTASFCGYTYQYEQLQAVWERYRDQGLIVLGTPSNDFGRQEPGTAEEIVEFCEINFAITFPMTDKIVVKGSGAAPLYALVREILGEDAGPHWNFNKYLIDKNGIPVAHWPSNISPDDERITTRIEALLADG